MFNATFRYYWCSFYLLHGANWMRLIQLNEVKPICLIASDNVVLNGDLVFHNGPLNEYIGDFTHVYDLNEKQAIFIINCRFYTKFKRNMPLKIKLLWIWHMVILRKSHVYLTGALR